MITLTDRAGLGLLLAQFPLLCLSDSWESNLHKGRGQGRFWHLDYFNTYNVSDKRQNWLIKYQILHNNNRVQQKIIVHIVPVCFNWVRNYVGDKLVTDKYWRQLLRKALEG